MDLEGVEHAITAGTWSDLDPWLTTLSGDDRATARKWYRGSLRATARELVETSWEGRAFGIQVGLALALSASPAEASRNCTWARASGLGFGSIEPRLGTILLGRGPEWAREFAELAIAAGSRR